MNEFEKLLHENLLPLQRYVNFKIGNRQDAEDILQDVCLTATLKFDTLRSPADFKAWLIGIAKHKCMDYYRRKAANLNISLDSLSESALCVGRLGIAEHNVVRDTMKALDSKENRILYLYFFKNLSQETISKQLGIPIGTVKSRLHYAKEKFRQHYPSPKKDNAKGESIMKKLPDYLPDYKIKKSELAPFSVRWEELQGWFILPRLDETLTWGLFDMPSRKCAEYTEMKVIGKAEIHGIEGVEISAIQHRAEGDDHTGSVDPMERRFVVQLTDTHCRYLAESHMENGVRKLSTFLDGSDFLDNWGFGEDNCGNEVNLTPKGLLTRSKNEVVGHTNKEAVDVVGRYTVQIGGKSYDTICVMDIPCFNDGVASEQYLDKNGRTVLWRRFNKNDWAYKRYGKLWTEMLPENERLIVNGETYVHWYDCVSDTNF